MHCNQCPLISIIIPVYQVEKYLDKCIVSVVNQTYTNLEIILVDDGSLDNCPAICDAWKERDSRITVIHQQNGGLSVARNEGLKIATGEFIGFVDSDDWIEPNMYETLLMALLETEADIAVGGIKGFTEDLKTKAYTQPKTTERKLYSAEEALKRLLLLKRFFSSGVWNKLYRRLVISDIEFPEGRLHEDVLWSAQVIGNAKNVVCINQICYHYLHRLDSISHDARQKVQRVYDELEMNEQRLVYIHSHYPSLEKFAILRLQNLCCREYIDICLNFNYLDKDYKIHNELRQHFRQYKPDIFLDLRYIGKCIVRLLFWISPSLIEQICNIIKKKYILNRIFLNHSFF